MTAPPVSSHRARGVRARGLMVGLVTGLSLVAAAAPTGVAAPRRAQVRRSRVSRGTGPAILPAGTTGPSPAAAAPASGRPETLEAMVQPPGSTLGASGAIAPLTTAAAIRALSPERAEQALPVAIRGVITYAGSLTFIQDQTAGIFLDVPVSAKGRYHVGEYGELQGFTAPGLFAPQIVPARFNVVGVVPLPPPRAAKFDELSTGKLDSQRVEIVGIVRAIMPDERPDLRRTVTLKVASDDGVFPVTASDLPAERLRSLVDATVRVRGVVAGVFNQRRQMIGIKLNVGRADDLIIDQPGATDPYAVPATAVANLLRFQPEGQSRHRVRLSGTVTLVHPGAELYLEDGTGGVEVRSRQPDALAIGDRVQVLGFPAMGPWTPFLDDAIFRREGQPGAPVAPISVTADQELSAGAHDSRLVSLDAQLVDMVADVGRVLLVAKSMNVLFDAELAMDAGMNEASGAAPGTPAPFATLPAGLRRDSRLRLTGISVVRMGADRQHPEHFALLLRGPDDVVILQRAPWLTLGRLITVLVALALLAALAMLWGLTLRRRMGAQTAVIQRQLDSERKLERRYGELLDNAYDAIYTHDSSGRLLTVNRAAEAITGYTRPDLLKRTIFDLILPELRPGVTAWLARVSSGRPVHPTFEAEVVTRDGRVVPLEINTRTLMEGDSVWAIEGVARDVSARKRAQAELAAAHRQLMETSRRAGMAEVAAGVLHNVGHVLMTVTASSTHLADQLRGSRLPELVEAVAALQVHAGVLPAAPVHDPPGGDLPQRLAQLAAHLSDEHAAVAREAESLVRSIEHIKEIVTMQQGYARVSGVRESVAAEHLMEDALRIHREALERHRIDVVREFAPAPALLVEKHKVLEILVTLLGNARHACEGGQGPSPARITVRVDTPKGERSGDRVRLVVADNGVGIAPQNLRRVFDQGFAARPGGQGSSLHSAFATARDLGGALFAHSDGVGKGARFTLDLPVRPPHAELRRTAGV